MSLARRPLHHDVLFFLATGSLVVLVNGFFQPHALTTTTGGRTLTDLYLFSMKNSENTAEEPLEQDNESDFPSWVKGLRQWPLIPSKEPPILQVSPKEEQLMQDIFGKESQMSEIPLAKLINVEALLMASGEDTMEEEKDLTLFEIDSKKYLESQEKTKSITSGSPLSFLSKFQEFGDWNNFVLNLQKSVTDLTDAATETSSTALGTATESILKGTTARLEYLLSEVSTAISPQIVQDLVLRAGRTLTLNEGAANDLVKAAEKLAQEQGLDVRDAADRAQESAKATVSFVDTANALLVAGYADRDTENNVRNKNSARPLYQGFKTARIVANDDRNVIVNKAAEMGTLCGAIYEDTIQRTHQLEYSIVANGTTANVVWMVTDSVEYMDRFGKAAISEKNPFMVRTVTIRGFDASDENVDREQILLDICTATPESIGNGVYVHTGLLKVARAIYTDVISYIDNTAPSHKIVINGHSVGGSISQLILLLLARDRGADFVKQRIARVYAFGSPPIATYVDAMPFQERIEPDQESVGEIGGAIPSVSLVESNSTGQALYPCEILGRFDLPSDLVFGYVQPWDPIVRLFSSVDPLYPLIGDIGRDGVTPYASGPPRTLRPITRAIIESWDGWPRFRDSFKSTVNQNYTSIGIQHILLPDPVRYLSDRLVAVNVQIPPVDTVLRISAKELLPALSETFPLDVFRISYVPTSIRSFIHHFYPAYGFPIVDHADKKGRIPPELNKSEKEDYRKAMRGISEKLEPVIRNGKRTK